MAETECHVHEVGVFGAFKALREKKRVTMPYGSEVRLHDGRLGYVDTNTDVLITEGRLTRGFLVHEPAPAPEKPAACPECGGTGGAHGTECPHRPSGEGSSCPDGCELWPVHENAEGVLIVYTLNDRTYRALDRMPSDARFCGRYWARSMRGEWMTALEAGETRMVLTPRGWELVDKTNAAQAEPPSHVAMRKEW